MATLPSSAEREPARSRATALPKLRGRAAVAGAGALLMLLFMGATLPTPLYVIYREELDFSEITLTLIYAVYFGGAVATAIFLGWLSDEIGRRRAILAAIAIGLLSAVEFIFAGSVPMLILGRLTSGFGVALAAGAGTAWVAELCEDRVAAATLSAGFTLAGLGLGPLIAGILAQYSSAPLTLPFIALLALGVIAAVISWFVPETVKGDLSWSDLKLRPRIGVPRDILPAFIGPAVTGFATFSLIGFNAALTPSLLAQGLNIQSHAIGGAVVFELFAVATATLVLTRRLSTRTAMLSGLVMLVLALGLLVAAREAESLTLVLIAIGVGGAAAALGYRGSLQMVNRIAPDDRRGETVSTYLTFCYAGVSLPVVGVGLLATTAGPVLADEVFAVLIAVAALAAIAIDLRSNDPNGAARGHGGTQ